MLAPIRFLTTSDGVRLAYCVHGEGPPLVFVRGWISHLEILWADKAFRTYFETLSRHYQVVRYDTRGNGLSDRTVSGIDLDALVRDLEAVMDGLALADAVLYGAAFGGPIVITYAARHPDRVAKLILDGTYACGREITTPDRQASIITMLRDLPQAAEPALSFWTNPEPRPGRYGGPGRMWQAITPQLAVEFYTLGYCIDVSQLLPEIKMPTLVLHRRASFAVPFRLGRELASSIPNARFVALEGTAHNAWEGDARSALRAVSDFLGVQLEIATAGRDEEERAPRTILFTDIQSSTALRQRLGDAQVQELVRQHNAIVREALKAHGGTEIKHTGDGIMASFSSGSAGLECAVAIQRAVADYVAAHPQAPLGVYIGLNAGEPIAEEQDLFGTSVDLARRICDQAGPGEILASDVVRQLAAGKGFLFSDRGEVALKGFDEPQRLWEVHWREE